VTESTYIFTFKPSGLGSYLVAGAAVALALLIALLLPVTGSIPFVIFVAAVMVSAWYGGLGPGLLATALAVIASGYFLVPPFYALDVADPGDLLHLILFILVAVIVSSLNQKLRTIQRRAAEMAQAGQSSLQREQKARAEAEAAVRAKDEFVAVVTHELRTPLNSILGWAVILQQLGWDDRSRFDQAVKCIERNARLQNELIQDLLDMSRIFAGKLHLNRLPVDVPTLIDAAVDGIRPAAEAKRIRLLVDRSDYAATVSGDANRLQQVLWNLLTNAVKFTPEEGVIEVSLKTVEGQARIIVRDSGRGIEADFLPYIFERFRQAEGEWMRNQDGLGLGLAIVRHLVELHEGTIQVGSSGKGQGSTFTIRLPLAPPPFDANRLASPNTLLSDSQAPSTQKNRCESEQGSYRAFRRNAG